MVRALGSQRFAAANVTVSLDLDERAGRARLTLAGPSAGWFGVGFGAFQMRDRPYAVIVDRTPTTNNG